VASDGLVTHLRERQNGRSLRVFARELGVSHSLLGLLLAGRYSLGPIAARRIEAAYPELHPLLADAVMETPADRLEAVS
jgi:hypothetical protein